MRRNMRGDLVARASVVEPALHCLHSACIQQQCIAQRDQFCAGLRQRAVITTVASNKCRWNLTVTQQPGRQNRQASRTAFCDAGVVQDHDP